MRRTLAIATFTVLTLAACGSDADSTPISLPPTDDDTTVETVPEPDCIPEGGEAPEPDLGDLEPPATNPDKPEVEIPAELPTELERTVLQEGTGDTAASGDTIIVDYIGVRSSDGLAFDNSYDRFQPFPVTLGQGQVIQGWDDGLTGSKTGERVQLDIPFDQAYGEAARDTIICASQDLTFVVDVHAVVKPTTAEDGPSEPGVDLSVDGVDSTVFEDLTVGEGAPLELDDTVVIRYVNFRGDNGDQIETNWGGEPLQIPYSDNMLPGLLEGLEGMNVGGRRAVTIPPEDGFGDQDGAESALPADTDMIIVIDLLGTY